MLMEGNEQGIIAAAASPCADAVAGPGEPRLELDLGTGKHPFRNRMLLMVWLPTEADV